MSEQELSRENKQKLYLRDVVMRQTDYDIKQADEKLKEHNYNAELVIRDYMGITTEKKELPIKSVNQQIYGEIRHMMDEAAYKYRVKKEIEEKQKNILEERRVLYEKIKRMHIAAYKIQCKYRKKRNKKVIEITI